MPILGNNYHCHHVQKISGTQSNRLVKLSTVNRVFYPKTVLVLRTVTSLLILYKAFYDLKGRRYRSPSYAW
jgi:hypothetical protein